MSNNLTTVNFAGVEESAGSQFPDRCKPGVHDFTITGCEFGNTEKNSTPYADVSMISGTEVHTETFYLTTKALPKLKHMLLKAGVNESLLSSEVSPDQLSKAMIGKSFRGRLGGREFVNKEGVTKIAAEFPFSNFAQPMSEANTLVFDPSKHITRLETTSNASSSDNLAMPTVGTDDLPF